MCEVKFMKTKERCLDCGEKLVKPIVNKEGQKFCTNWCKDNWEAEVK